MKKLSIGLITLLLTGCAGVGIGVGSYENEQASVYFIGVGVKGEDL
jgi:hypothetical protein